MEYSPKTEYTFLDLWGLLGSNGVTDWAIFGHRGDAGSVRGTRRALGYLWEASVLARLWKDAGDLEAEGR